MEKEPILLLIFLFLLKPIAGANDDCLPATCGPLEPEVRFPFHIVDRQPSRCGFPGFDLSCNEQNKTTIGLPSSGSYIVNTISYFQQVISIDLDFCRPNGIVSVDISDTPFSYNTFWTHSYIFYNCSLQNYTYMYPDVPFACLTSGNYTVIASLGFKPSYCKVMKMISLPARLNSDYGGEFELTWFSPDCKSCDREGKACRVKSDGQTVCGSSSHGIPRGAKYGLGLGIGIPALICISALVCYTSSREQGYNDATHNQSTDPLSITMVPQPTSRTGLDGPTIESYPITVLGDSCRLPNDDGTCVICLSDYKPKESLRTIPECNHYFHSECIDKWLRLNATCPVCRKTPESSVLVTPSSSSVSSSSRGSS